MMGSALPCEWILGANYSWLLQVHSAKIAPNIDPLSPARRYQTPSACFVQLAWKSSRPWPYVAEPKILHAPDCMRKCSRLSTDSHLHTDRPGIQSLSLELLYKSRDGPNKVSTNIGYV